MPVPQDINSGAPDEDIVTGPTIHEIVTRPAIEQIVQRAAKETIVALFAEWLVRAGGDVPSTVTRSLPAPAKTVMVSTFQVVEYLHLFLLLDDDLGAVGPTCKANALNTVQILKYCTNYHVVH